MDIIGILSEYGYRLEDRGSFYRTAALFRGGKNRTALAINKKDGRFVDFGASNQRGSFEDLLKLIEQDEETVKKYLDGVDFGAAVCHHATEAFVEKTYPKEILKKLVPHWDMYLEQGISEKTMRDFEVGMGQDGKLNRRYVFPIYSEKNQIVGFAGRWHQKDVPSEVIKWKNMGKTRKWVYPCHLYPDRPKRIVLVESIGCSLRLYENGCRGVFPVFGLNLGPELLKYLLKVSPEKVFVSMNNEPDNVKVDAGPDSEGQGNDAAKVIEEQLLKYFPRDKVEIQLPTKKDFMEMSNLEASIWLKRLDLLPK